jgi:hypothetical protein
LAALPDDACVNISVEIAAVFRDEVGQVAALGVVPDLLGRTEVRSIGGKPLHRNGCGMTPQISAHDPRAMDVPRGQYTVAYRP